MNRIIVGTDGSGPGLRAVEWAAEEAERRRLSLRIVHAVVPWLCDTHVDPRLKAVRQWMLAGGQEIADAAVAAARVRAPGIDIDGSVVPGGAAKALLERARDAAMVVLGTHGTGTVAGLLLGSTALQVVVHTPVPAVVIRHTEPVPRHEVAVGVDGAAGAEPALAFAFEEAASRSARLRAVHVWSDPGAIGPGDMTPLVYDQDLVTEEHLRRLDDILATWQEKYPDVQVEAEVVHGRPVRVLAGVSARADLLVVGARGHGGFTGLVLGSVSHGLLHHAHCPLAVVPSGVPA